jgi:hypothetical protein
MPVKNQLRINIFLIFFLLSTKPEIVVPGIRFRYFIFEISGKMTNYAVFLPSLALNFDKKPVVQ